MNNYSRFVKKIDENVVIDTSTIYYQKIAELLYDSSGCKQNIAGQLKLLNYGSFAVIKGKEKTLFLGQFGNPTAITFDPFWEYSQIGSYMAKEFGRGYTAEKIEKLGYKFTPDELLNYVAEKGITRLVFGGGDLTANVDFILDFVETVLLEVELSESVEIVLYTNGFLSHELINELAKVNNSQKTKISLRVWFYSVDNEFWIKHTKRNISDFYKSLDLLNDSKLEYGFALMFIPDENDSQSQIDRLATKISCYYGAESPGGIIEIHRFYPAYRIMDKESHSDERFKQITQQLTSATHCQLVIIDKANN